MFLNLREMPHFVLCYDLLGPFLQLQFHLAKQASYFHFVNEIFESVGETSQAEKEGNELTTQESSVFYILDHLVCDRHVVEIY